MAHLQDSQFRHYWQRISLGRSHCGLHLWMDLSHDSWDADKILTIRISLQTLKFVISQAYLWNNIKVSGIDPSFIWIARLGRNCCITQGQPICKAGSIKWFIGLGCWSCVHLYHSFYFCFQDSKSESMEERRGQWWAGASPHYYPPHFLTHFF